MHSDRESGHVDTSPFRLAALTPPGLPDPAIAIAAARTTGGTGILDLEFVRDPALVSGAFGAISGVEGRFGVKFDGGDEKFIDEVAPLLPANVRLVLLTWTQPSALKKLARRFSKDDLEVFVEATTPQRAAQAEELGFDGVLLKGNEAAGLVGEKTSFILLQQAVASASVPVWVQGGIGPHSVAACYAAGASGAVLDSQLYLTRESPLPEKVKGLIARSDGGNTVCVGSRLDMPVRVLRRYGSTAIDALSEACDGLAPADTERKGLEVEGKWRSAVGRLVGWESAPASLWLLGQDHSMAAGLSSTSPTVAAVFHRLRSSLRSSIEAAVGSNPLGEGTAMALSHGTRYPIVQGPMARVSDKVEFAAAVARHGALPFIAISTLKEDEIGEMLSGAGSLEGKPWGVGLLGFNDPPLYKAQVQAVSRFNPGYAVLAGGRPKQAVRLEELGMKTYVHAPSPATLDMFIEAGVRRFIFEGNECGGHIGPRSSFVLWDTVTEKLAALFKSGQYDAEEFHLLYAGGVHDGLSAAMVAALSAPLAALGAKVGVVMGTAYLFTKEIVETGGIMDDYQKEAIACEETKVLEISPGHALRCTDSPFVSYFEKEKRSLLALKAAPAEIKERVEALVLGRSRLAAKGMARNPAYGAGPDEPYLLSVDRESRLNDGLYMAGQLAALHKSPLDIESLHRAVSDESTERLAVLEPPAEEAPKRARSRPCDVAVVGMACLFPKANTVPEYWRNILNKVNAITEVPPHRWDWRLYFDRDKSSRDKIYSRWGGFLDDMPFDPLKYGIPPSSLKSIEPLQLMTLEVVGAALKDAGYEEREFNREKTSVILGTGTGIGEYGQRYILRAALPALFEIDSDDVMNRLNEWTEDSFPGILMNVLAGRVANRFNFGGVNYTIDAACASSLAALYDGVSELETGASDMVVVGGVDACQNPFNFTCFSKTNAFSPTGRCSVFDEKADGTVISEGLAIIVIKRLEDAVRDGDRVYSVIKSIAGSSDGRGRGLTAPRPEGQMRALKRVYEKAGFSPATVELFEAHGTGTVLGDQVEVESLGTVLKQSGAPVHGCAIGSVKSMIGHTKGAAGLAGLIKASLSLYHKVLPPTMGVDRPNPRIDFDNGPVYINSEKRPWIRAEGHPRRAGVSAFGFGGTNFHTVLEEYSDDIPATRAPAVTDGYGSELLLWAGASGDEVAAGIKGVIEAIGAGHGLGLAELAFTLNDRFKKKCSDGQAAARLAVVASSLDDLGGKLRKALESITGGAEGVSDPEGIFFSAHADEEPGKVAFLFPGQGSQYPAMLADLAVLFPEVRCSFETADTVLRERFPEGLSRHIFTPPSFTPEKDKAYRKALARTDIAQPAIGAASYGVLSLLRSTGLKPDMAAGHSYGEYTALSAAGVFDERSLYKISEARGRSIIDAASGGELGTMAAVRAGRKEVEAALGEKAEVVIANLNAPEQTVISGSKEAVAGAVEALTASGLQAQAIPVAAAFHSPLVAPAKKIFAEHLAAMDFAAPSLDVYSNNSAEPHPEDADALRSALVEHIVRPVRFVDEIESMYDAGARVFVEVGPGSVLTNLTRQILGEKPYLAVSTDLSGGPTMQQFAKALGQLAVANLPVTLDILYRGRRLKELDLENLGGVEAEPGSKATWLVNGTEIINAARPRTERPERVPVRAYRLRERRGSARNGAEATAPEATGPRPAAPVATVRRQASPAEPPVSFKAEALDGLSRGQGASEVDAVMQRYQRMMERFMENQRAVMLAYLNGTTAGLPEQDAPAAVEGSGSEPVVYERAATPGEQPAPQEDAPEDAAAAAAPVTGPEVLRSELLRITSERTGYPEEMLKLDVDMEADLGIDSIKKVEILNELAKALPEADGQRLREVSDELSKLKSMQAVIDRAAEVLSSGAESASSVPAEKDVAAPVTGPEMLRSELLRITSERTGYPEEMLKLDVDMEADLGIDSIKKVEILNELAKALPEADGQRLREVSDELSKLKSMQAVINRAAEVLSSGAESAPSAPEEAVAVAAAVKAVAGARVPRCLLEPVMMPVPEGKADFAGTGLFIITDDGRGVALELAGRIREMGGSAVIVAHGPEARGAKACAYSADLADSRSVAALLEEIRSVHGPVSGLIHLLTLRDGATLTSLDLPAWRRRLGEEVKSLFLLSKAIGDDLRKAAARGGAWLIAATALTSRYNGASFNDNGFVGQAGVSGFVKTVAQEWTEVNSRVVNVDMASPAKTIAGELLGEISCGHDAPVEVEYYGGKRLTYRAYPAPVDSGNGTGISIDSDWVILVTGGAVGITAEVAIDLAGTYRPTIILAGRSELPTGEPAETAGLEDERSIKAALIERLKATDAGVTPAAVDAAYSRLMKDREMAANIAKMRSTGAKVEYRSVDVRDEAAFGALLDWVYSTFGRLDGIVHGAGVIEDKLIDDKTPESFDRVFDTKADSAFILTRKLKPGELKFIAFFSSVSGAFGNRGQADYAAANELVNKLALALDRACGARVVALNWGPWKKVGMVSPAVERQFNERGIQLIPPVEGIRIFEEELKYGKKGEVEVVIGEGPWTTSR